MSNTVEIIILMVGLIIVAYLYDVFKDKKDLQSQTLDQKFQTLVSTINKATFDSKGEVTRVNKSEFNLFYAAIPNQRIYFVYGTGHLTIIWKYKYIQKEVVHEKIFYDVRDIDAETQQRIGEELVIKMAQVVKDHKIKVAGDMYFQTKRI